MDNSTHELSPATYTVQDVFGFPSQMPLQGFAPGHPLVPKATAGYVWDAKLAKDFIEWLTDVIFHPHSLTWFSPPFPQARCSKRFLTVSHVAIQ
jgi:hypothetical protein